MGTKQQSCKIYVAKPERTEKRNRQIYKYRLETSTPLSKTYVITKQKTVSGTEPHTINQQVTMGICRTSYLTQNHYKHPRNIIPSQNISWARKQISARLNELKSCKMFSGHSANKLEILKGKITGKSSNICKVHLTFLNNPGVGKEISREI